MSGCGREELTHRHHAGRLAEVAVPDEILVHVDPGGRERLAIAGQPRDADAHVLWPGDGGDPFAADASRDESWPGGHRRRCRHRQSSRRPPRARRASARSGHRARPAGPSRPTSPAAGRRHAATAAGRRRRAAASGADAPARAPPATVASASQSCNGVSASIEEMPRMMPAKNGSPNSRSSDSEMTSATESVRWVTRARAARLGT